MTFWIFSFLNLFEVYFWHKALVLANFGIPDVFGHNLNTILWVRRIYKRSRMDFFGVSLILHPHQIFEFSTWAKNTDVKDQSTIHQQYH